MKLNNESLQNRALWNAGGFSLPEYDRREMAERTRQRPEWIHFGAGNIFRAFPAAVLHRRLNAKEADTGVIVAEGYDYEIIEAVYKPHDNLSLLVTLKADGSIEKTVVGSVAESLTLDSGNAADWGRLKAIFASPSLRMASFTITEKGYSLRSAGGEYHREALADFEAGPEAPISYIGKLAALCYHRCLSGRLPLTLVSMDNCSHNGTRLHDAVAAFAEKWEASGAVAPGFAAYVNDPAGLSFPWTMIDKITPRPDEGVQKLLRESGFEDAEPVITSKNTYTAPFVNAEEAQYLIVEDAFPNGRPRLAGDGVIFTDRETVDKVEKMKVCTCLNPLHTALAIFGCLLGYDRIHQEMKDPQLSALVREVGYTEGLPVVVDPGIMDPKEFLDTVVERRLVNPFMPDSPQRIATDTSQKLAIRFGETIKAYAASPTLKVSDLRAIPLVLAGWCRYLLGVNDDGQPFALSPDPMLETVTACLSGIRLGDSGPFHSQLKPILSNTSIFGLDLYEAGLGERIEACFAELIMGKGAVRKVLVRYLG